MFDLIYCDRNNYETIKNMIKEKFPLSVIEDCSDYVHQSRFSVLLKDDENNSYIKYCISSGIFHNSFHIQLLRSIQPSKFIEFVKQVKNELDNIV